MDCQQTLELIGGSRGDDLDEAASTALLAHIDACAACREALAGAEAELAPLGEKLAPPEPSAEAWARVGAAVRAQAELAPVISFQAAKARQRTTPLFMAVAAAVLLALGAGLVIPLEPLFGPPRGGATATLVQPGEPGSATPVGPVELPRPGVALRLVAGPRYQAQSAALDDLLVVVVTEKR